MNNTERYYKCKENGICVSCHKREATKGLMCNECRSKKNEYGREEYAFRKKYKMCVKCGKERVYGDSVFCLACKMDKRDSQKENYKPLSKEQSNKKSKKAMEIYYSRKGSGICVKCGKRPSEKGYVMCNVCRYKKKHSEAVKRKEQGVLLKDMGGNGIYCATCLKPVETKGNKLCDRCYQNSLKNVAKALKNPPKDNCFRKLNNAFWSIKKVKDDE